MASRSSKTRIGPITCKKCGACCISPYDQDTYCDVEKADVEKLGRRARHVLYPSAFSSLAAAIDGSSLPYGAIKTRWRKVRSGPLQGGEVCACHFLTGDIMNGAHCSIYRDRPAVCKRAVIRGDRACRHIRKAIKEATNGT